MSKYIKILEELLDTADIIDTLIQLEDTVSNSSSATDIETYEQIYYIITKCMLKAEKLCRKLYKGEVPLSPDLVIHLTSINFWQFIIRGKGEIYQYETNNMTTEFMRYTW